MKHIDIISVNSECTKWICLYLGLNLRLKSTLKKNLILKKRKFIFNATKIVGLFKYKKILRLISFESISFIMNLSKVDSNSLFIYEIL